MFDIVVVGGGPIGSEVAFKMASSGYFVAVIEKRPDYLSPVCCTGIISQECVDTFAIDTTLIKRQFSSARFFSPSGTRLYFKRETPLAGILDRASLDAFMAERAQKAGTNFLFNTTATALDFASDRVKIGIKQDEGFSTIEGRVVVLATGAVSALLNERPEYCPSDIVVGGQAIVDAPELEEIEIYAGRDVAPGFFGWLVPVAEGHALAGLLSRQNTREYINKFIDKLRADRKILKEEVDISFRPLALTPPGKTCSDRLIVVGGAAGQIKPTTGGGIFYGLLSAHIAAGALAQAFKINDLTECGLASYERGCKRLLGSEMNAGRRARGIYERMNDAEIDALFGMGKILGIERYLSSMKNLSFDWHERAFAGVPDLMDRFEN